MDRAGGPDRRRGSFRGHNIGKLVYAIYSCQWLSDGINFKPDSPNRLCIALDEGGADSTMTAEQFLTYFSSERFLPELRARSKDGVLAELTRVLADDGDIRDPGLLLEMIRRRESLGSTGVGRGVAIPHGRSTAATQTKVVFARSSKGIEYESIDREPCQVFFLIVAPYEDRRQEYLPLLGKIVETVSNDQARQKLIEVQSFEAFRTVVREVMGE
jgi:nitrogen PTS system EIIA component